MNKYTPLKNYLVELAAQTDVAHLTFAQIEAILGRKLPPSARHYSSWWVYVRQPRHAQKIALTEAGWRVERIHLGQQVVVLRRLELAFDGGGRESENSFP